MRKPDKVLKSDILFVLSVVLVMICAVINASKQMSSIEDSDLKVIIEKDSNKDIVGNNAKTVPYKGEL